MPDVCRAYDAYEAYEVWKGLFLTPFTAANSFHRLRAVPLPRGGRSLGRGIGRWQNVGGSAMRELLPPSADGPPPSKREGLGEGNRTLAECRRARDARPYNVAGNCNCEMRLQRWVASLQRLDAFATVGCTAVLCRGAHCAPVSYIAAPVTVITTMLRAGVRRVIGATAKPLYPIDGKAVGLDRRSPRPPSSREGNRPQAVEGV